MPDNTRRPVWKRQVNFLLLLEQQYGERKAWEPVRRLHFSAVFFPALPCAMFQP
jgi:hypothetical protein